MHPTTTIGTDSLDREAQFATREDGTRIAYRRRTGKGPGILFLGGFRSDMEGTKARALDAHAAEAGRTFLRFDYFGHGLSDGRFEAGTIGRWTEDAVFVLDTLTQGPQVLVGSSLGGWLALLIALKRPERVAAILTVSLAADFTRHVHDVIFGDEQRRQMAHDGQVLIPDCHGGEPYAITRHLIEEAEAHFLLPRDRIAITAPVRLIHGQLDQDVPWSTSLEIAERVEARDVRVTLVKDGEHQLARPVDLALMLRELDALIPSS